MDAMKIDELLEMRFKQRFEVDADLENKLLQVPTLSQRNRKTVFWAAASVAVILSLNIFALLQSAKNYKIDQVSSYYSDDSTTYYEEQ